ncbi:MAG: DUF4097 family beta strand repeat-containing protein [Acetivibrionales bacterium]
MKARIVKAVPYIAAFIAVFLFFAFRPENRTKIAAWPVIGIMAEDKSITSVDAGSRTKLSLVLYNGDVKITQSSQGHVQIVENRSIKGPARRETLMSYLEANRCRVESAPSGINIDGRQLEGIKPLFGYENDIELILPASLASISISIDNGSILVSGLEGMSRMDLSVRKGRIHMEKCNSARIHASAAKGTISAEDIRGRGVYNCGRGNIQLSKVNGEIELVSVSGDTVIEGCNGRLNCDVSSGSITVRDTRLKGGSVLYATNGNIEAELGEIDAAGKYSVKAASGEIRLEMPQNTGYSLTAKSARGRVYNEMQPVPEISERTPSAEVYSDVGGGGASIDVYIDRGNIYLR